MAGEAADTRTRRQKLEAMASQLASPAEAAIARAKLADIPPPRTLSRASILGAPDRRRPPGFRRVWDPSLRVTVVLDDDDPAFRTTVVADGHDWSSPHDWDGVE